MMVVATSVCLLEILSILNFFINMIVGLRILNSNFKCLSLRNELFEEEASEGTLELFLTAFLSKKKVVKLKCYF